LWTCFVKVINRIVLQVMKTSSSAAKEPALCSTLGIADQVAGLQAKIGMFNRELFYSMTNFSLQLEPWHLS
jgi:hypothetical protein